jgi:group I intron endonuclease
MNNKNVNIFPAKIYPNLENYKYIILKENSNKSGVYRLTNLINGKSFIGSARDLSEELNVYFSPETIERLLTKNSNYKYTLIYKDILEYGCDNFSLDILEYL